jgi:hypothetical protein
VLFLGTTHAGFGDDERHRGRREVFADVADKMGHIAFLFGILGIELVVDAVISALMPAKAGEHVAPVAGFGLIADAQAALHSGFAILDIPEPAGPAEDSEFVGHVVAHSCEATTGRFPSVSHG